MRLVGCLFIAVWGALAQAGAPIFTHSGPMACGMRPYAPGTVQEWCYDFRDPTHPKTVCNAIHTIAPVTPDDTPAIAASQSCFATVLSGQLPTIPGLPTPQVMPCAKYQVTWLAWRPIVAIPSGSTGTIVYQVAASQQSGTVSTNGACVPDASSPPSPPTTLQQGSFSDGIVVAGLGPSDINGLSVDYVDVRPNAQWNLAAAPGLAVISTSGIAHAVTPTGLCIVESGEEGMAQFGMTNGKLRVAWLRDNWCPGGLGSATMLGACSPLGLTMEVVDLAAGRCSATPDEPTVQLANAVMYFWNPAPTVQGR